LAAIVALELFSDQRYARFPRSPQPSSLVFALQSKAARSGTAATEFDAAPCCILGRNIDRQRGCHAMVWTDFHQLLGAILVIVGGVLPVVNPPGDAPLFLRMTAGCDDITRGKLARHVAFYSFTLLLGSLVFGSFVLRLFDLSVAVIQVAGGAVVCALGWKLLNDDPKPADATIDPQQATIAALARSFYPLTMPLTIDPGVMSVAVTIGANHSHTLDRLLIQFIAAVIGSAIVALSILLTYRYAERFAARIGHKGMNIVVRLSAFIVLSIGVQIGWNGVKALLTEVGIHA
jgi:multiple antibiotic resistance protein